MIRNSSQKVLDNNFIESNVFMQIIYNTFDIIHLHNTLILHLVYNTLTVYANDIQYIYANTIHYFI